MRIYNLFAWSFWSGLISDLGRLSLAAFLFISLEAGAIYTEIGSNYNYKKSTYDTNNNFEQQSSTFSLSFYFWEQLGLELSYTNGLAIKKELATYSQALLTTTTQYSDVYGADLIYVLSDKQSKLQPYIKGGAAYVKKRQVIQAFGQPASEILPSPGVAPSYGAGFKFFLTESLALRAGYDVIHTPIDDNTKVDDIAGRIGLSWIL
jgi:opacity protein-like surface antigen